MSTQRGEVMDRETEDRLLQQRTDAYRSLAVSLNAIAEALPAFLAATRATAQREAEAREAGTVAGYQAASTACQEAIAQARPEGAAEEAIKWATGLCSAHQRPEPACHICGWRGREGGR